MEALKGDQHKIDKNKNGKVDAHDFKILRGEKKVNEDQVEEGNNPFDVKNYKSQLPTKPGEKAGFDSKKVSTGTVYTKKPVKEEAEDLDEAKFDPLKHIKNPNPAVKAAAKDVKRGSYADRAALMKAGGVKDDRGPRGVTQEESEQIDELKKSTVKSYMNKKVDQINKDADLQYPFKPKPITKKEAGKNAENLMRGHARISGAKPTSEEVEDLDEAQFNPLKHIKNPNPAVKAAAKDVKRSSYADRAALMKAGGVKDDRGTRGVTQEEVDQIDERSLSTSEKATMEKNVKGMKKSLAGFKARYGKDAKSVMYATATKNAKED